MRKDYSWKSYDPQRLPSLVARIGELLQGWELEVFFGYRLHERLKGDEALARLADAAASREMMPTLTFRKEKREVVIVFQEHGDLLLVGTSVAPLGIIAEEKLQELAVEALGLTPPSQDEIDSTPNLYDINKRIIRIIRKLEAPVQVQSRSTPIAGKSCFVSFNFDEHGLALAFELRDFLEALDVSFVSGHGYEPRPISNKVLERMRSSVSLFIVLFTRSEGMTWLQQEIGAARALQIPIMVLVEDGVDVQAGLLADNEHVCFPKNIISKSFISVIQAIRFVSQSQGS
jgi:hypothetical protein